MRNLSLTMLMFCLAAISPFSFASLQLPERPEQAYDNQWLWAGADGNLLQIKLRLSQEELYQSNLEQFRVNYTLQYPRQAMAIYLTPRLNHAVKAIHQYSGSSNEVPSITQAINTRDDSPGSQLFWSAYMQYQGDAMRFFNVAPCVFNNTLSGACLRPDYSSLFYNNLKRLEPLALQFKVEDKPRESLNNALDWLSSLDTKQEDNTVFAGPAQVVMMQAADSDERALLLAILVSHLAPELPMYVVYSSQLSPESSPVWLALDARSGLEGPSVMIDSRPHVIISGPKEIAKEQLLVGNALVSTSIY
ncbi:hypothetical protein DBZ36_17620 [Alginatibacterium sediminis]|uniref:Uncharacterized protein n=1 Tax=Alginatibacterium sediminis TaxID=2164068 RepID=A0A420E7E5_9ALTE|nr:hypothetical protein [Alginatibacterium sediminis]RKF14471.1 hypothetical protein DBZ36_17620 [Alginatibacterium sediminis]